MAFTIWIPGRLPGLNELLAGNRASGRWNSYNEVKCKWFGQIQILVRQAGLTSQGPGCASALWLEPHRQRDPDNVLGGGFKLLLDAFAGCDIIAGDGWNDVLGLIGHWELRPGRAGCLFHWGDELLTKASMLELLEKQEGKNGEELSRRGTADHPTGDSAHQQAPRRRRAKPRSKFPSR